MFIQYIIFDYFKEIFHYSSFPAPFEPYMTNTIVIRSMKIRTLSNFVGQTQLIICYVDTLVLSSTL